jgi:predicted outer membrane repeat protein
MKKQLLALLVIFSISLQAQTDVSGNQSGTWTLANSPYQITGDITVPAGEILTIEAGVHVVFQGHYKFTIDGQVLANGTNENLIVFTATDHNIGWNGIRIDAASAISVFTYCQFEYGIKSGDTYEEMNGGALFIKDADAQFFNCIFNDNQANGSNNDGMGGAIYAINTGGVNQTLTKFIDCIFENNSTKTEGGAIKLTNDSSSEFTRCQFINNNAGYGGGALLIYVGDQTSFNNCLFYMNSATYSGGGAIKTLQAQSNLHFTHCTIAYNSAYGNAEGGACDFSYADVNFINSIIYGNSQQYGTDIHIGIGATCQIDYCDLDMPDDATGSHNLNNLDPLFENVGQRDFHLKANSPCIDAGLDIGLPYNGAAPDLGCYESGTSSIQDLIDLGIRVYPNPATDFIVIDNARNIDRISLVDFSGKSILLSEINNKQEKINLTHLKSGFYLIRFYKKDKELGNYKLLVK